MNAYAASFGGGRGQRGRAALPTAMSRSTPTEFAVLIPLLERGGSDEILLTLRRGDLPRYAGQVCFPGGARDADDADLRATALRETWEEVGIPPESIEVVAELRWFVTGLGHRVRPYVGRVPADVALSPCEREVERIVYLPSAVARSDPFRERGTYTDAAGRVRPIYTFTWDGVEIWGLTARILRSLFVENDAEGPGSVLA